MKRWTGIRSVGFLGLVMGLVGTLTAPGPSLGRDPEPEVIGISFQRFVLDNGLTVIVHEDHKAPIVAVNLWYHVGSKNEKPGRTGLAHLFEHLMFNGSENHDDDYFKALDRVGATELNGTTNGDRTNYFQNVPTSALDVALWMESDRMGHLLGAVTQERLDEQRGVVQNEKRQGENQPYGKIYRLLVENAYPRGHPYSWSTIGSMEDLEAATLEDVHEWFRSFYGAANAVLVIAGDVDAATVREKVERAFGDIPSGPPVTRQQAWIAKREGTHRVVLEDRVAQARLVKAWNVPGVGTADGDHLLLVADLLASGKNSRLYRRLVYDDQIATEVEAFMWLRELGGLFVVEVTAQPGQDLGAVERGLDEELARLRKDGPRQAEVERVKVERRAAFVRGVERVGGFGGKSDILARSQVYGGRPDAHEESQARLQAATREQLADVARRWLADGTTILEVRPFPSYETAPSGVDRSRLPEPGEWPEPRFPALQRAQLESGVQLILAERREVPLVNLELLVDAGYAADQGALAGTASLAMNVLDEGAGARSALEISEALALLGATLTTGSNLDMSWVRLSALRENLDPSLEIFADVILAPAFEEAEFQRLRKQQLATIQREQTTPFQMALRVFPRLLYGADHAYGLPFTGSGTEASVARLTRDRLRDFHRTWFKPNGATLIVVGDTSLEEIVPRLERLFRGWQPGSVPDKKLPSVSHAETSTVYLIDRPGSLQSIVMAGHVAPPGANPDEIAIEAMNEVLGGSFSSRLNMNLREDKQWSYGAHSFFVDARGQRPFLVYAPVQTDKTADAMQEIRAELRAISGAKGPTGEEVARARDKQTLTLPGRWETGKAVSRSIAELVRIGLPDDHWERYPDAVRSLEVAEVVAATRVLRPDRLIWVVVGDRAAIEPGIRALGLGELRFLNADGEPAAD